MSAYLVELTGRLSEGLGRLPETQRALHATYLTAAQQPDGGFSGREGGSDLYYTGFALRSLAILGQLHGDLGQRSAGFLKQRLSGKESVIDFLSLIYGAILLENAGGIDVFGHSNSGWREAVAAEMEELRRDDGGYARSREAGAGSTYHSFLVLLCMQLIDVPVTQPNDLVEFFLTQQDVEGGFREFRVQKRAGTNATAAAIGGLKILDAIDEPVRNSTIDFLAQMQTEEGGLRANTRIPIADLLSTFTGCLTLADLRALDRIDLARAMGFVTSLEQTAGGFRGALWDEGCDVEYTFYGLGCLALLIR